MPGFLTSLLTGALTAGANALFQNVGNSVGGAVSNGLSGLLGGASDRVRREDVEHNQNMADIVNPREIRRQSQFLTGIAPAQAEAYNTYQDATHAADTAREVTRLQTMAPVQAQTDLQYMDTVYAGTSPWERLGSSAAPSISAPNPTSGAPQRATADVGSQFLPLITAQIAADTQKQTAMIAASSQQSIAKMQTDAQLKAVGIQTNDGKLPEAQTAVAAAQELQTLAQTDKTGAETEAIDQDMRIKAAEMISKLTPSEVIDLGVMRYEHKPGWKKILPLLTAENGAGNRRSEIESVIKNLPADQWAGTRRDMLELAGMLGKGAGALKNVGSFLGGFSKGKW